MAKRCSAILIAVILAFSATFAVASPNQKLNNSSQLPVDGGFLDINLHNNQTLDLFNISTSEFIRVYEDSFTGGFEKINMNGTLYWNKTFSSYDSYLGGKILANGTFVVAYCKSNGQGTSSSWSGINVTWYNQTGQEIDSFIQNVGEINCKTGTDKHGIIIRDDGTIVLAGTFIRTITFGSHSLTSGHYYNHAYSTSGDCRDIYFVEYNGTDWAWAEQVSGSCTRTYHSNLKFGEVSDSTNNSFLLTIDGKSGSYDSCTFSSPSSNSEKAYTFFIDQNGSCMGEYGPVYFPSSRANIFSHRTAVFSNYTVVFSSNSDHSQGIPTVCIIEYVINTSRCGNSLKIRFSDVSKDSHDRIWITGEYSSQITVNGFLLPSNYDSDHGFVGYFEPQYNWVWLSYFICDGGCTAHAIVSIDNDSALLSGVYTPSMFVWGQTIHYGLPNQPFIALIQHDTDGDGHLDSIDSFPLEYSQWSDIDGDGYGDNPLGNNSDDCPNQLGNSTLDFLGCTDSDGDGQSNQGDIFPNDATQMFDFDSDGFGDNLSGAFGDTCPSTYGQSTRDRYGCPDTDIDGWSNENDTFPDDFSQWADTDGDGYGDQLIGFQGDACPTTFGNSTEDRYGCPDEDGDGWSDDGDDMLSNPTQWSDRDGDGYGDNATGTMADLFPSDGTQWNDTDGDSHGDNPYGSEGDWFPDDPERWADTDRDGVADEDDEFVNDPTQWNDTDGDGHGDEIAGNQGDAFPDDPEEWQDSDSDGLGNNADDFPFDPSQQTDSDGDGFGDNPLGTGADRFPQDSSQWSDIDGDGYGDNESGNNSDVFITDATQWADMDGDGYGDNQFGNGADMFPDDETQWADQDGDGLGDNPEGNNPDPYLLDFDNDGYNDSIDILPKLASPGDLDNDGCLDEIDLFPTDYRECLDNDGDGIGDNADTDDDNDGWTDTDEIREDTDPLNPLEYPIEAFQLMVPGTTIGLDGWDLIGIFGGVPLFTWIIFGFVTRNARCRKFEKMLNGARTKKELEDIALKSEHALMIRLLGPHQGIRLERLRAELDDALEGEGMPFDEDHTEVVEDEMAEVNITEEIVDFDEPPHAPPAAIVAEGMSDGATPEAATAPPVNTIGIVGQDGYEWLQQGGATWYRPANSNLDWKEWVN